MNGACTVNGEQDVIGLHQSSRSTTWIHLKKRRKKDEKKKKKEKEEKRWGNNEKNTDQN